MDVNAAALELLGYTREEYLSLTIVTLRPETARERMLKEVARRREQLPTDPFAVRHARWGYLRRDGSVADVDLVTHLVEHNGSRAYVSTFRAVVSEDCADLVDALLGLPGATAFEDCINSRRLAGTRFAVLLIRLDHLRDNNMSLGRRYGDAILRSTAARIKNALPQEAALYRIGGGSFGAVLPGVHEMRSVRVIARRVVVKTTCPVVAFDEEIYPSVAVGISIAPTDGTNGDALWQSAALAADTIDYQRLERFAFFDASLKAAARRTLHTETLLRKAVDSRRLAVRYQPLIDTKTGAVTGAEALLRWDRNALGKASVSDVIKIAEKTGLICDIGEFVLREACAQGRRWQFAGAVPMRMCVNVSAQQLQRSSFLKMVTSVCETTGFDPRYLELELTETAFVTNADVTRRTLAALRRLGVRIAVDDFGTGYSALSYLGDVPLDTLKIDRSFVERLNIARQRSLVESVVSLARKFDLRVVAEGVEEPDQVTALSAMGCDELQGFYFSPAVPGDEFSTFVRDHLGLFLIAKARTIVRQGPYGVDRVAACSA